LSRDRYFEISIFDSYLILPNSLSKLATAFNVTGKLSFNVLNNNQADLNDPAFRSELLTYNKQDCKVLYDVLITFNNNFKDLFHMSIFNSPTLPSLAFKLWKSNFVDNELFIPITWAEDYNEYKSGYKGGAVDVYKPYGKDLYYYDVNSLYPSTMRSNLFPTGDGYKITGDIWPLSKIFGLVKCKVTTPDNLYAPILLNKDSNGRVTAPSGTWIDWYCSEELKLAVKYGYKVEVLKAYHWESQSDLFSGYVDTLYNYRLTFPKSDPRNTICKLLLNSLYGKFGMSPTIMEYSIWKEFESLADIEYDDKQDIGDITLIGREETKNNYLIFKYCQDKKEKYNLLEISTPIAIFTTAYSRMLMAEYKIKYSSNLYYSDTDSLVLDCLLPDHMVGDQLGQFKLEYEIKEGVFLGPKVYGLRFHDDIAGGTDYIKVKSLKNPNIQVSFEDLKGLLFKDSFIKLQQDKWFRFLPHSNIKILNSLYILRATENKRTFNYKDGVIIDTKPFVI